MGHKRWILMVGLVLILVLGIVYTNRLTQAQGPEIRTQVKQTDLDKILNNQTEILQDLRYIKDELREIKRELSDIKQTLKNQ